MRTLLTLTFLITLSLNTFAQLVRAGLVHSNMTHVVLSYPDTLTIRSGHISNPAQPDSIELDLDQDGYKDLYFTAAGAGSLGLTNEWIRCTTDGRISSYDLYFFNEIDSINTYRGNYQPYLLQTLGAKPFDSSDQVSLSNDSLSKSSINIYDYQTGVSNNYYALFNNWKGKGVNYLAFCQFTAVDTLYGWIKLEQEHNRLYVFEWAYENGLFTALDSRRFENPNLKLYPNPVNDILYIDAIDLKSIVEIYSMNGNISYRGNFSSNGLDVSSYEPGVYFLKVIEEDKGRTIKFVKN